MKGIRNADVQPLRFPESLNSCGEGNAQVVMGSDDNSWRIFLNGHHPKDLEQPPPRPGPRRVYLGLVTWDSDGQPKVTEMVRRGN